MGSGAVNAYGFWFSEKHGLIRQRSGPTTGAYPEVWRDGYWRRGSPYVMDAIVGMGEDPWSCGEWADAWDKQKAETYAAANGIDLFVAATQTITSRANLTTKTTKEKSLAAQPTEEQSPARKALRTAKWARIMTKWMISHASKDGVKWQVVGFNGKGGQESKGIVDMIAIRKNHSKPPEGRYRGDLFEIVLIQVKGGNAKFPSSQDMERLREVKDYHGADKVVLVEWKKGQKLCCYLLSDTKAEVPASEIFGKVPSSKRLAKEALSALTSL